jgi:hypothetical protein
MTDLVVRAEGGEEASPGNDSSVESNESSSTLDDCIFFFAIATTGSEVPKYPFVASLMGK